MTDLTSADQQLRQLISDGKSGRLLIIGGGITGAATFAKAAAAGFEKGINRATEPVLSMRPID